MATQIYLGKPPAKIVEWIKANIKTGPNFKAETQVVYADGSTWEGLIEGQLNMDSIPNVDKTKEIIFGNKVTYIPEYIFTQITFQLETIAIPDSVTGIGENAFAQNFQLTSVFIQNNSLQISNWVFFGCDQSLTSFPNSTTLQVEQWFKDHVFGRGENHNLTGPAEFTITCKDGIVHAVGKWNEDEEYSEGWDITITPL